MNINPDFYCLLENLDLTLYEIQEDTEMLNYIYNLDYSVLDKEQQAFADYLAIRMTRNIIVCLDCALDEPSDNSGINLKKLLNSYQSLAVGSPKDQQEIINKNYKQFIQCYDVIRNSDKRKELKTVRDKMFAHMDFKFIKNEKGFDIKLDNMDASLLVEQAIYILGGVCTAIGYTPKTTSRLPGKVAPRYDIKMLEKIFNPSPSSN